MKSLKLVVLALMAALALSAVAASTASASAKFVLLPGESFPDRFTASSGASVLETVGGLSIKCTASTAKGELKNATEGAVTITYTGCKEGALGCRSESKATKVKDAVETILIEGQKLYPVKIKTKKGGVAFKLAENLRIVCGAVANEVRGAVIGSAAPFNTGDVTEGALTFNQILGLQQEVKLSDCEEVGLPKPTCAELLGEPLEAKKGGGVFEPAGFETTQKLKFTMMGELNIV